MLFDPSPGQRLIGIAKLASQSELLQAKREVEYFEISTRSVLNRCKPTMPFRWTINPYRGCEFGCKYCYARYTHEFMERDATEFEDRIYAKAGVAEILKRELRKIDKREAIAIGTATDPYQPAERRFLRTRSILEVFAKERGWRLSITTKSDMIQRDVALLTEISRANVLDINITITTLRTNLARLLEPRAPRPDLRLETVKKLSEAGIVVGVFPNPILPLITDREKDLDRLAKAAKDAGAQYFGGGVLFLMPSAQKVFFPVPGRTLPAPGAALRRALQKEPLPARRLHRRTAEAHSSHPRPLRPRLRPRRLPPRAVGRRAPARIIPLDVAQGHTVFVGTCGFFGRFDFGALPKEHYSLGIDSPWGGDTWFDVEVGSLPKREDSVLIDISPVYPDCSGGNEFLTVAE